MKYYIDSCIWLNLIKREAKRKQLFWKFAKDFLEQHKEKELLSSSKIIDELESKGINSKYLVQEYNLQYVDILLEDFLKAR